MPAAAMSSWPSGGDLAGRRPGSGSEAGSLQRAVAEWLRRRVLRGSPVWSGLRLVRFPVAAALLFCCTCALSADTRPDLPPNAATCTASGTAIYPAAATYISNDLDLWAAAAVQQRRRPLKATACRWLMLLFLLSSGDVESNPGPALRIFSQNVCSLNNKLGTLRSHAGELAGYDAICFTETWLSPRVADSELQLGLPDHTWFRRDRSGRGGGVACAVNSRLSPVHRPDL